MRSSGAAGNCVVSDAVLENEHNLMIFYELLRGF